MIDRRLRQMAVSMTVAFYSFRSAFRLFAYQNLDRNYNKIRRNKPLRPTGLTQWGRPDSNQRPPAPEAGIIPS